MLRCVKRKSSKSRTPTPSNSNERGCSTLPRMRHRSESDENVSEKPSSSSSRLTRWAMEKKSATLTAGCTLSGNESKTKSKPFTFLRTLSLSSLFSPSRRRRKDDSTTAYSSGLMSPDVEMHTFSNDSQPNIQQREDETDVSPSEGSLTPTAEETYQHGLNEVQKQDLFLKKLTKEAFSFSRDETNKTPTDEKPNVLPEQKHFNRHSDEQHDSGRSSTRESAEVSLASDKPRKDIVNGFPNESVKHLTVGLKRAHVAAESKQADADQSFLRAARAGNLPKVLELLNTVTDINISNTNGLNALHLASKEGRTDVVHELLSHGASVSLITKKGNTALHIASLAGHLDIVKLLIDYGADVNAQSQNGFTPLYMSAQENHVEVVHLLLDKSANQALSTEDGFTPLAVALQQGHDRVVNLLLEKDSRGKCRLPALHIAAKKNDVHAANLLLNNTEINVDHASASGFTALHIAAHYGNVNITKLLIERNANVNYQAKNYITPLHVAAKWGKKEVVNELIQADAEVNAQTRDGLTPLHCAARAGQTDSAECLLKHGANLCLKTKNDLTPLHMAAQGDHEQVACLLLQNGSNPDDITIDYLTPLHVAAHCGSLQVARTLLNSHCNVNARALNGFTALHIACKKSRVEMASLLLKYGALLGAATETGLTPLHVSSFVGCIHIVSLLLQRGTNVNQTTLRNETALHLAARNRQVEALKVLLGYQANLDYRTRDNQTALHVGVRTNYLPTVELLLKAGADPNILTKDNYSALHIAIKEDSQEIVQKLVEHGADPEMKTKKGFTPLHLSAKSGSIKITELLLHKAKSDPNATARNGFTPVHVAAYYNNKDVLSKLIECGGDVNRPARNGFTPLHLAVKRNHLDSVILLASKGAAVGRGSRSGYTPLHLASQDGQMEIIKHLVEEYKAEVNCAAKDGLTPLHLAVQEDKVNAVEYLLNTGASVYSKTLEAGFTPLHSAAYRGQLASARLLLARIPRNELSLMIDSRTHSGSTPLHLAAQQGHLQLALKLIQMGADRNARNKQGWTAAQLAQKQHYLNLSVTLQAITTNVSDWSLPNANWTNGDGHIDSDLNLPNGSIELEKEEHMTDHITSDSEDEGGDSDLTAIPGTPMLDAKPISVRPKTLHIPEHLTAVSRDNTVHSSLHDGLIEERVKPVINEKIHQVVASQQLAKLPVTTPSPAALSEWDFDVDNVQSTRKPVKSGFLISFLVDARGCLVEAQRRPDLRFLVPPNAPTGPLRIICRLLRPQTISNPPSFNDGDCLACRIIEMNPYHMRFTLPILIEVPHIASVRGREREIVIIRSETGNSWKEHTLEATEQAIHDALGDAFDLSDLNSSVLTKRVHRILTYDFPQYFALLSRFRQEVAYIGSDGGLISSTVVPQVQAVFPPGSLQKRIKVGLQAQPVPADVVNRLTVGRVSVSAVVSIEPRRRKFHKPITLTMPVPCSLTKVNSDAIGTTSKIRLLCSLSGGENPPVWEDITGSTPMTIHKDCVSFTTTVSARLWLIDCPAGMPVTDLATRIYNESTEPPILGRFIVYARQSTDLDTAMQPGTPEIQSRHSSNVQDLSRNISRIRRSATEFAQIRCLCLTDDTEDKTLECLENYYQIATGPFVEIQQNKPIWIEMIGNLVPVLKSGEQLKFIIRPFYENRITFPVRLREVPDRELNLNMITGKIAFMRESRTVQTTEDSANIQTQRPITVLEFKLPSPDQAMMLSTRESDVVGRSDMDRRKLALEIGEDWRRLASLLGFSEQDIKMIDRIPPNAISAASGLNIEHQRAETLLTLWKHRAASSGLTDRDALGSHLADALNKINRSDAFHPSMTNIRPVSTKEEIITANAVLENRSTLPMVVEEKSHFTPNKILMSLKQEIQDTFPSMKYQEVEDMQEQDSEPVLSWSEKDFLSSDEGVSTISVSGIKDGVQKSKAIVNHPAFRNDVRDQEKLHVNVPTASTSITPQIKSFVTENLPVKTPVVQEIIPEDKIYSIVTDINETSPINRQSVSFRVGLLTKPNQMVAQGNEEPDGLIKEVFIKSTAHHIEQISPPTDRKHVQHIAQELAEVLGTRTDETEGSFKLPQEDIIEQLHALPSEDLLDDESFKCVYERAILDETSQHGEGINVTEAEIMQIKPNIEIPTAELESEVSPANIAHKDSPSSEAIQPIPKDSYEFEELEEILPDGTIVTKLTEFDETTLSVTLDEWEQGVQAAIDSGQYRVEKPEEITEVEQVDETLLDGTVITRLIKMKRVVDRVYGHSFVDEQLLSSDSTEQLFVETNPEVSTKENQNAYHEQRHQEKQIRNYELATDEFVTVQMKKHPPNRKFNTDQEKSSTVNNNKSNRDSEDTNNKQIKTPEKAKGQKKQKAAEKAEDEIKANKNQQRIHHAKLQQEHYKTIEEHIDDSEIERERKLAAIGTELKDLEEIDGGAIQQKQKKKPKLKNYETKKKENDEKPKHKTGKDQMKNNKDYTAEEEIKQKQHEKEKTKKEEIKALTKNKERNKTTTKKEEESEEKLENKNKRETQEVPRNTEEAAETAAQPESEGLAQRVGEMLVEYGEVGEGVVDERQAEGESPVQVLSESLGEVEVEGESEAAAEVQSERVSVFAVVGLQSEAAAETAAQPESEGLAQRVFEICVDFSEVFDILRDCGFCSYVSFCFSPVDFDMFARRLYVSRCFLFASFFPSSEFVFSSNVLHPFCCFLFSSSSGFFPSCLSRLSTLQSIFSCCDLQCRTLFPVCTSGGVCSVLLSSGSPLSPDHFVFAPSLCLSSSRSSVCPNTSVPHDSVLLPSVSPTMYASMHIHSAVTISEVGFYSPLNILYTGLSDFTRVGVDSTTSLEVGSTLLTSGGLLLGLSQFLRLSSEPVLDIPDISEVEGVVRTQASTFPSTCSADCHHADSHNRIPADIPTLQEISSETFSFFTPEAALLAVSGFEHVSLDELGSANVVAPIVQDSATLLSLSSYQESSVDLVSNEYSAPNGDRVVMHSHNFSIMNPSDFPSDGEFHSFDNSNNEIINVSLEKTAVKTKGGCENFHSITSQCAPTETIGTESTSESDIFEKSSLRGKADLTYLAAASGANLAVEFTEEEEEEESAVTCATRMKIPEHGDAGQLLHSALDRSVRVLNRLQTYGFRGSPSTVNIPSNHLNRHTPETKIPASYNETCESVKTVSQLQKDYQNTPASNLELLRVKELDDDELDDFDGDSLEDFNSPFELKNMDEEFITAGANEPECEDTGLSPLRETVMTEQAFNDDNELKINSESQSESHFVREIMTHQYSDSEYTGSCHSISSATAAVFSSEYEYQTNSTPNESSKGSQSTVVNIGVIRQSPVTSSVLRRDETANKQGKQGSGVTMRESVQLLESRDTLASVESDLNLVDKKIKLSGGSSMLPLGRSLVHLSSNSKKRPINSIPNLLRSEPVIGSATPQTSTDFSSLSVSQPLYITGRQKSAAQNDFREPNDGHAISFPHLSQEHQVYEIKDFTEPQGTCVSDSRPHSPQLIIDRAKKQEISNGNVTSTSLSEFERLEKELGTSNSTSPSNGHKGSGEDISSHTSSLSEYLRHEKECEICDERLIIPWDSQLKSKLDEGIDVNAKVKTIFSEMLPSSTVIPAYGQISTIYEDIAEHHISSLSQSIESRSTSPYSNKDAEQISFTYMYHKNEHQSQTGCSDSEVSIIHSKMSCDLLEAEKILESLTSSSEIDFLLDGVDDPLTGVDETDSLIYSSIYDSLIPSVYENSVLEGTSNVIVGTYNNWSDTIAHGIDSLDESEHAQFNKVTDSLCTTSSSVNSNQMSKTETEKADTGSHGITEFDSAHVDVLHQQYIGLIDEKQSCDLLLNETYFIQKVSSISDLNQTHSTLLTEQEDSSTCMSRAVKNEFLNPSMNPNVMTDSLDDSASFGQMSGSVPESKCSLHAGSKRLGVASLSSLITQLGHNLKLDLSPTDSKTSMRAQVKTTVNIGSSSVVEEESATNTFTAIAPSVSYSSLQSSCQTGTEFGLISRIDSNLESNIFDTSEDEIVIEKTFVSNVQKQSLNKIQSDSFATGSHSNVTEKQEVKHSEKLDKIESEESHRSVKLLDQTSTESVTMGTSLDLDYEIISITETDDPSEQNSSSKQ